MPAHIGWAGTLLHGCSVFKSHVSAGTYLYKQEAKPKDIAEISIHITPSMGALPSHRLRRTYIPLVFGALRFAAAEIDVAQDHGLEGVGQRAAVLHDVEEVVGLLARPRLWSAAHFWSGWAVLAPGRQDNSAAVAATKRRVTYSKPSEANRKCTRFEEIVQWLWFTNLTKQAKAT